MVEGAIENLKHAADTTGVVIVAIPKEDDYVWKISSEKIPHMTLCYLGDQLSGEQLTHIGEYLQHVAEISLFRFDLSVDRRGSLGPDEADVVFFQGWDVGRIKQARGYLLQDPVIQAAYNAMDQYPEWLPHLTLGYPESPANEDDRDYPGVTWVAFDKIALWTGNYDGPTFDLKSPYLPEFMDLAMSDVSTNKPNLLELSHHGIKGQKWGVRRKSTSGGTVSEDSAAASAHLKTAKTHGTSALSNKELQSVVTRMNLEQQYSRLAPSSTSSATKVVRTGFGIVKGGLIAGKTINEVIAFKNSPAGKFLADRLRGK